MRRPSAKIQCQYKWSHHKKWYQSTSRSWYNMASIQRNQIYIYTSAHMHRTFKMKKSFTVIEYFIFTPEPDSWPTFEHVHLHTLMWPHGPAECEISLLTFLHWFCFYLHIHVRFSGDLLPLFFFSFRSLVLSLHSQLFWLIVTNDRITKWSDVDNDNPCPLKRLCYSSSSRCHQFDGQKKTNK